MNTVEAVELSSGSLYLLVSTTEWEVLCITLRLAKVFSPSRCLALQTEGGTLSQNELQNMSQHIADVLLPAMEENDFLMPDLTLSDHHPRLAFLEGDPRRTQFLTYSALQRLHMFSRSAREVTRVWRARLVINSR